MTDTEGRICDMKGSVLFPDILLFSLHHDHEVEHGSYTDADQAQGSNR